MIAPTVDLYDRVAAPTVPPLGDTEYAYRTASARETAGVVASWATQLPVVLDGDGSMTQSAIASASSAAAAVVANAAGAPSVGGVFSDAINHTLLGVVGIVILGIGLFFLVKE